MSLWRQLSRGVRRLVNPRRAEENARDEVSDYIARAAAAHATRGLSPDESLRAPTFGTFEELRARTRSFTALAAADRWEPSLTGTSQPERLHGQRVSADYFKVLGVHPAVGRDFSGDEDHAGGPNVAIVSARLVPHRFHGDREM